MTEMNEYLLAGSEVLSREFNDLASFYSDFHKDLYGVRPRSIALCASAYPDHASLVEAMSHLDRLVQGIHDYMHVHDCHEVDVRGSRDAPLRRLAH